MNIQYYGYSCFKITTKPAGRGSEDVIIFLDPFDKTIGLRPPQGNADLVLISYNHPNYNSTSTLRGNPYIIDIPGEYSIKKINLNGIESLGTSENPLEQKQDLNTIYILESENLRVCHLGNLGSDLNEKQLEAIDGVDILMIPIGKKDIFPIKKTVEIIKKIEPKIIIPTNYKIEGLKIPLDDEKEFCAEIGNCPEKKVSKLNIKKKDLSEKNMEVVLMSLD